MFKSLQDGLQSAFKTIRGRAKLTEANMRDGLRLVEQSLLDADVSYDAVKAFMGQVTEAALGERVMKSLDPGQQLVGIVHQELVKLLGPVDYSLHLKPDTTVIMLCGLQGSGKTTTCGKLASLLKREGIKAQLVALDLKRPAAIRQLHVLGEQLDVPVYSELGAEDTVAVARNGVKHARENGAKVVILDTAGRLAIDEELMQELSRIDAQVHPDQVYLVVDGMTGQDAVKSAKAFNEALELNGVIMTKLDGDARGGALLSVKYVTGVPVKFIGIGEHLEDLEPFRPEGMADRILNMGDVVALVDKVRTIVTEEEQKEMEEKMSKGELTLDDFKVQLQKMSKPGLLQSLIGYLPGMGQIKEMMQNEDAQGGMNQTIGIINSMTEEERKTPKVIDQSRRNRISKGAGVQPQAVNELVKQFETMKPMMQMMSGQGAEGRMEAMKQMQESGMFDPGSKGQKIKQGTGRRLNPKDKAKLKKQRDKEMRKRKRKD
ncbi:MAG: signal recognition particle subunit SRP54 [Pirellulaceae bacterium]|jgi:signal recognition particle subunit SRP54